MDVTWPVARTAKRTPRAIQILPAVPALVSHYCGLDLPPVPHDPSVLQKSVDAAAVEPRDLANFEVSERCAKNPSFVEYSEPAQPGLKSLET